MTDPLFFTAAQADLPRLAISVRQPWAHAVIYLGKDIENRDWSGFNPGLRVRGRVAIHASAGMTRDEYERAAETIDDICMPAKHTRPAAGLIRGAIIGSVEVVDVVSRSTSPWFFGPLGLVLRDPQPVVPPIPCKGALGFFDWRTRVAGAVNAPPAKWMLSKVPA